MRRNSTLLIAVILLGALASGTAMAQNRATVGGTVKDAEGNRLKDVLVTVFSPEEERTDTTSKKGRFGLVVMDSTEPFRIRFEKEGFETLEEPIEIGVGEAVNETWTLQAAADTAMMEGNNEAITAYNAAATAFNAGDFELARSEFEKALGVDPELIEARKVLTLVYFQLQEWDLAASSAAEVMAAEPDNLAAIRVGFDSSSQLGDRERAEQFLEPMIALGPGTETAKRAFNQGIGDLRAGDREAAIARFEQAIELDPTLGVAYNGLASVYLEDEDYDKALGMADRLMEVDPGNAEGLGIRYEAYRRMGDEANMLAALEELQSADPERIVDAYYKQGMLLFNENNAPGAVEAFERVLAADPEHARAHYQLGRAYLSAGDYEKGKQYLERFIEMAPEDPEVEAARSMLSYLD